MYYNLIIIIHNYNNNNNDTALIIAAKYCHIIDRHEANSNKFTFYFIMSGYN